ncbi:MAG: hypothetical protein Q4C77_13280 [Eubacteriales bacterium]|nr:hypothetical protein [Eubacteriales bacterium]
MRMKRSLVLALFAISTSTMLAGYNSVLAAETKETAAEAPDKEDEGIASKSSVLEDGVYSAEFDTDSSMFHVNEANEGRGILTVKDGEMTIHVSLVSKSITSLFAGTAEDAQKEGAELLEPTTDKVTYSDGWTEEVYGFDIPVPTLDEEFDVALIGKKGKWYDHKVVVTDPQAENAASEGTAVEDLNLEDGSYTVEVALEGGSGKATVETPAVVNIQDQKATAEIIWSSSNYDYMLVDGEKYEPVNTEGNSAFEIPVPGFDYPMPVTADTVAMSTPHEIDYTLTFDSSTLKKAE